MEEKLFKSITEVSRELDLPTHVLRFWEDQFDQIKPVRRSGSRRYYHIKDVEFLKSIKDLLYRQGYTIKGAKKMLRSGGTVKEEKRDVVKEIVADPNLTLENARLRSFIKNLKFDLTNLRDILS
ncbi:MAG: MerR family transcriptional regulator [Rickettsiales bacterium]|jgi:DNA-binding transcriptional MerR regulator|nr:MerR family transcriptional regulator [Rickettsiales bacterium]